MGWNLRANNEYRGKERRSGLPERQCVTRSDKQRTQAKAERRRQRATSANAASSTRTHKKRGKDARAGARIRLFGYHKDRGSAKRVIQRPKTLSVSRSGRLPSEGNGSDLFWWVGGAAVIQTWRRRRRVGGACSNLGPIGDVWEDANGI